MGVQTKTVKTRALEFLVEVLVLPLMAWTDLESKTAIEAMGL